MRAKPALERSGSGEAFCRGRANEILLETERSGDEDRIHESDRALLVLKAQSESVWLLELHLTTLTQNKKTPKDVLNSPPQE